MTQIRETIEKFCVVLKYNGISEVTAETFRLAKFDNAEVVKPVWTTLKNMIIWLENSPKSRCLQAKTSSTEDYAAVVRFCKHEMFNRGYRVRSFFVLPENMSFGSREILLAIGWLMAKENMLQTFSEQVRSVITEDVPFVESYCTGIASQKFLEAKKVGTKDLGEHLGQVIQEVILLKGKLNSASRSLLASRQEYGKILKKIHAATLPFPPKPSSSHLSAMDVHLLYNAKELSSYQENLEIENLYLHSLFILMEREALFWKWLESVVDLRENQQHDEDHDSDSSVKEECLVFNQEGYRPNKQTQNIKAKQVELSRHLQQKEQLYQNVSMRWKRYRQVVEQSNQAQEQFQTLLACLDQEVLEELEKVYNNEESQILTKNQEGFDRMDAELFHTQGTLQFSPPMIPQSKKHHRGTDMSSIEQSVLFGYIQELQKRDRVLKEELIQLKKQHNDRITKLSLNMNEIVCIPPSTR